MFVNVTGDNLPSTLITTGKLRFRALIDSGSMISVAHVDVYKKFPRHLKSKITNNTNITMHAVNGNTLNCMGSCYLKFQIGKTTIKQKFILTADMSHSLILGWNFLKSYKIDLISSKTPRGLQINGEYIELEEQDYISSLIRLKRNTILKPFTAMITPAKHSNKLDLPIHDKPYLISSIDTNFLDDEPGLEVPSCVVSISKGKSFPVLIVNHTARHYRLKKGTVVASIQPLEADNINEINLLEPQSIHDALKKTVTNKDFLEALGDTPEHSPDTSFEVDASPPSIHAQYKDKVLKLLDNNSDLFATDDSQLKRCDLVKMKIETTHPPIRQKPYRLPYTKKRYVKEQIKSMLEAKVIRPSHSPWASPIVLVGKKDGGVRFCCDFRALNSVTDTWYFPLPHIDDLLAEMSQARYFSNLDLRAGYWQIELAEEDRHKTAFITDEGLYEWNVMAFGLKNSPSWFQETMSKVLDGLNGPDGAPFARVYLDDVIIFSRTPEEHIAHIQAVMDRLRMHNLRLKKSKCSFFSEQILYLGYIINKDGIKPDPEKVTALQKLPDPKNVKEVRSFLGMAGYYRRFCPNYARTALPLTGLTKKNARFSWTPACQLAFRTLIDQLSKEPILAHPSINDPYILYCDASLTSIGAVLAQNFPEGERPIHFLSHKLTETQTRWPIVQTECFAIYFAVQKFRPYLYGSKIIVRTDHKPLQYLFTAELTNHTMQKWATYLSEYNITIEHIPGSQNVCSDFLSRINWPRVNSTPCEPCNEMVQSHNLNTMDTASSHFTKEVNVINLDQIEKQNPGTPLVKVYTTMLKDKEQLGDNMTKEPLPTLTLDKCDVHMEQSNDPQQYNIKKSLEDGTATENIKSRYIIINDLLYYLPKGSNPSPKLMVPLSLQSHVLRAHHEDLSHLASQKCYELIATKYHWKNIYKDVLHHCLEQCQTCKEYNLKQEVPPLQESLKANLPFQILSIDLVGYFETSFLGNKYILTVIDQFTSWPEAFPIKTKEATEIADVILNQVIPRTAVPLIITSDRGKEFCNRILNHICRHFRTARILTSPFHPQSNYVENFHAYLGSHLRKSLRGKDVRLWDTFINPCLASYRFCSQESNGISPFFALHGFDPTLPLDTLLAPRRKYQGSDHAEIYLENLHQAFVSMAKKSSSLKEKQRKLQNQQSKVTDIRYKVGDPVYYYKGRAHKLDIPWEPHYRVVKVRGPVSYNIRHGVTGKVKEVHAKHLKKADLDWPVIQPSSDYRKATLAAPDTDSDTDHLGDYDEVASEPESPIEVPLLPETLTNEDSQSSSDNSSDVDAPDDVFEPDTANKEVISASGNNKEAADKTLLPEEPAVEGATADPETLPPYEELVNERPKPKRKYTKRVFPSMRDGSYPIRSRSRKESPEPHGPDTEEEVLNNEKVVNLLSSIASFLR